MWTICDSNDWESNERRPGQYGPIAEILEKPFCIVYGTQGSASETRLLLASATRLANQWFLYGNGNVSILADTEVISFVGTHLIVLGGPNSNSFTKKISPQLSVHFSGDGKSWKIGPKTFSGTNLGTLFLSPLNKGDLVVVVAGTNDSGFLYALDRFPIFTGMLVPDFLVIRAENDWKGDGAAIAAGFWGNYWEFEPLSSYLQ